MADGLPQRFGAAQGRVFETELSELVCGKALYTGDSSVPGQCHAVFVRSPFAHGTIRSVDTARARSMPGVLAVYTGAEVAAAGLGSLQCTVAFRNADGSPMAQTLRPLLARGKVRFVGEAVAMVVAEEAAQAEDAAQAVAVDVDMEPAVSGLEAAMAADGPAVWDEFPDNRALHWQAGDAVAVEDAMARASHVARVRLVNTRVVGNAMEPRAALGWIDPNTQHFTLVTPSQGVNALRHALARILAADEAHIRVVTPQVGGGFGVKTPLYPEQALVLWASRELCRPVKWTGSRAESFLADNHGRDSIVEGELAVDSEGRFLALKVRVDANMGAYLSSNGPIVPTHIFAGGLTSVYATPAIALDVHCRFSHTGPTGPYRGAGRPEAAYLVERLVDEAARDLAMDAVVLRRRNFIAPQAMPYRTPMQQTYDSGCFAEVLDRALQLADWSHYEQRRQASLARGHWRGRGLACFLETAGGSMLNEPVAIRFGEHDTIVLQTATQSNGQGHLASLARVTAETFDVPLEQVRVAQGDSDRSPPGHVSVASRTMMMAGSAAVVTARAVIDKGRDMAAHLLEVAAADIEYVAGRYQVLGTDRQIGLFELARRAREAVDWPADLARSLDTTESFVSAEQTFPNGCHVCEVEIDPATGVVKVVAYTAVDDCGRVIEPAIVHAQLHGGIAQGLGQVLGEHCVFDEQGQMLTGSFMDYPMPRADDLPAFRIEFYPVPSTSNPLGVKGTGEAGTVGALPAAMNAIVDALRPAGINRFDMPATPQRIWQALKGYAGP